ncbi:hypothetical protein LJB99_06040 [Deltaproteobacteria bacterium OttesenSCG-928-K17]|nr:hypothetical protein [Deltaproteobacteria bacterium OttesenSCG-928-K17]
MNFIAPISTKGGGIFSSGSAYGLWAKEMAPIEYDDEDAQPAPQEDMRLTAAEVETLAGLVRQLAGAPADTAALEKVRRAMASAKNDAELLKSLSA